jgi:hypothetical protein
MFALRHNSDINIRRLRLWDLRHLVDDQMSVELRYLRHLDIIFVTNLVIYAHLFGSDKITMFRHLGMLNSLDDWIEVSSALSGFAKRALFDLDGAKYAVSELNTVTGYLQGERDGFDRREELSKLAQGGDAHGIWQHAWPNEFKRSLMRVMANASPNPQPVVSFEEYVREGNWITSGSSSLGKMEVEFEGGLFKFKCKKNMLLDIYTKDELWEIVRNWDGKLRSRAFIKDELSKQRLAVASNIEAYLYEAYIMSQYGGGYKDWTGVTLSEKDQDEYNRAVESHFLMKEGCYALPFDFRRFDHQPTTDEIVWMVEALVSAVAVPLTLQPQWHGVVEKVLGSYRDSEISMNIDGVEYVEEVTGGLPSGVRFTSVFGNLWNAALTNIVRDLATRVLGYDPIRQLAIKGDDTALVCSTATECLVIRYCYMAVNAVGLDSKFGISQGHFEFLRKEIGTAGVRGWPCRAIAAVTQRKPWLAQPMSPTALVETTASTIRTLERRVGHSLPKLHSANKHKWSKYYSQSEMWLELPVRLGGYGVYPWRGWVPNGRLPRPTKPTLRVNNLAERSVDYSWETFTKDEHVILTQEEAQIKVGAADLPGIAARSNRNWAEQVRKIKVEWTKSEASPAVSAVPCAPAVIASEFWPKVSPTRHVSKVNADLSLELFLRQYNTMSASGIKKKRLVEYLEYHFPVVYQKMRSYEYRGWHRTDALELASGGTPSEPSHIHPAVTPFVQAGIRRHAMQVWTGRKQIALMLYAVCAAQMRYVATRASYHFFKW